MGINVNKIAGNVLHRAGAHKKEEILWFMWAGETSARGVHTPYYSGPYRLFEQAQTSSESSLSFMNMTERAGFVREFYINDTTNGFITGLNRPQGVGTDWLYYRGFWWSQIILVEGFEPQGWIKIKAVLQNKPPEALKDVA